MNRPRPVLAGTVLCAVTLAFSGCGDSAPVNPGPAPTPPPPARSAVVMTIGTIVLLCEGGVEKIKPPFTCDVRTDIRFNEYNGVEASVLSIRLDMYEPDGKFLERYQIEGKDLPGGATIPAKGVKDYYALDLYFSSSPNRGRYLVITSSLRDTTGYGFELQSGRLSL